jgi:NhaA family Na+:H+ antiporter
LPTWHGVRSIVHAMKKLATPLALPRAFLVVIRPFQRFFRAASAGGIVLVITTALALAWANSSWSELHARIFETPIVFRVGAHETAWSLHRLLDDGAMTLFFLVVGMEIKRELVVGELRTLGQAALPAVAALGGMLLPGFIYAALNHGGPARVGWGVPVATDIAFSLGCLALVRTRVPTSIVVFLAALAIFDDLGAIVVIAIFYGHGVALAPLAVSLLVVLVLVAMNVFGVRNPFAYFAVGFVLWLAILRTGVHATIAGVALGLCVPARPAIDPRGSLERLESEIDDLRRHLAAEDDDGAIATLQAIERQVEHAQTPLTRLVHGLQGFVSFVIVPLFALANAAIDLRHASASRLFGPVSLGVALGLFVGKQAGIFLFTTAAMKLGIAPKPRGATYRQLYGVAILAGIGFTMSLFISGLAFGGAVHAEEAKIGILFGSFASAIGGLAFLRASPPAEGARAEELVSAAS